MGCINTKMEMEEEVAPEAGVKSWWLQIESDKLTEQGKQYVNSHPELNSTLHVFLSTLIQQRPVSSFH